jgi:hypothetical protein
MQRLYTVGDIRRQLKIPYSSLCYHIDQLAIKPTGRIGNFRVFDEGKTKAIMDEIRRRSRRRG